MTDEEYEAIKTLINHYAWLRYNPVGDYCNICFTFRGINDHDKIMRLLNKMKIWSIQIDKDNNTKGNTK